MSLKIGAATDYLVTQATTAMAGRTVNGQPVVVCDGPYDVVTFGMFVIGLAEPLEQALARPVVVNRQILTMGLPVNLSEQIDIPCFIDVRLPGNAKAARDTAEAMFNAFNDILLADPSAGGLFSGGLAIVPALEATPSNIGSAAEPGQRYRISFTVRCTDITR